jgi:hypothetical protein
MNIEKAITNASQRGIKLPPPDIFLTAGQLERTCPQPQCGHARRRSRGLLFTQELLRPEGGRSHFPYVVHSKLPSEVATMTFAW